MRSSRFTTSVRTLLTFLGIVAALLTLASCKLGNTQAGVSALAGDPTNVGTTYYPYNAADAQNMGPGHFNCAQYNSEQNWYIAPSDTFGDSRVWSGDPCPYNSSGGVPQCSTVQKPAV